MKRYYVAGETDEHTTYTNTTYTNTTLSTAAPFLWLVRSESNPSQIRSHFTYLSNNTYCR